MSVKIVDDKLRERLDEYMFENYCGFFPDDQTELEIIGKDYLFFIDDDAFYIPRKEVDER